MEPFPQNSEITSLFFCYNIFVGCSLLCHLSSPCHKNLKIWHTSSQEKNRWRYINGYKICLDLPATFSLTSKLVTCVMGPSTSIPWSRSREWVQWSAREKQRSPSWRSWLGPWGPLWFPTWTKVMSFFGPCLALFDSRICIFLQKNTAD